MKSAGSNLYPDSAFVLRLIGILVAAVLAVLVGLFVVSYANPFTSTVLVAAIVMSSVAMVNPRIGLYLLIVTTGYLDLIKRLGILSDSLSGLDITVTLAVAPLLMLSISLGVIIRNILERRKLASWQWVVLFILVACIAITALQAFRGGADFLG